MGSTRGLLKTKLTYALGTSETNLFTQDKRNDAINKAVEHVIQMYPIPQYTVDTTLAFTSGVASLPTDFVRCWKLWNSGQQLEYVLIQPNDFDNNVSYTFTIKWNTAILPSGAESTYIYPADTVTLNFRYGQIPADMTSDSDTVRFPERWDDGIAEMAAYFLFIDSRNYDTAEIKKRLYRDHLAHAWSVENQRYQDPRFLRVESKFESMGILNPSNIDNWHTN
jgi:hypothetical protein